MKDPRVPAIRTRLKLTDGVGPSRVESEIYDDALVDAVKRFQARQGLENDGVIGASTIVAMNVPLQERIQSIVMAMERLRWMPEDLGRQYVIVNIAGFDLRRINGGNVEEHMAVVVGKPYTRTPVFSDRIRYVEFNPYWTVPPASRPMRSCLNCERTRRVCRRRDSSLSVGIRSLIQRQLTGPDMRVGISHFRFDSGLAPIMRWVT
jgi:hypothetical protein